MSGGDNTTQNITPSEDTEYKWTGAGGAITGTGSETSSKYDLLFTGTFTSGNEKALNSIYAETLHLNGGRYYVNALSDIANAGTIYVNAQLQFECEGTFSNDFVLGGSKFDSNATNGLGNVGLRIGYWNRGNGINDTKNTIGGKVTIEEDTKISFQAADAKQSILELSGTLAGSKNIQLDRYSGTHGVLLISSTATTSGFTGELDMDGDNTSSGSITLQLGASDVYLGGLSSNTTGASVALAEGKTSSVLHLNVAKDKDITYNGTFADGISVAKTGAGTQTLANVQSLQNLTVNAGTLALKNVHTINGNVTVAGDAGLEIYKTINLGGALSGVLTIGNLSGFDYNGESYTGATVAGNGYRTATYKVIADGSSVLKDVSVKYGTDSFLTDETGSISTKGKEFYIFNGKESSSAFGENPPEVVVSAGAALVIDKYSTAAGLLQSTTGAGNIDFKLASDESVEVGENLQITGDLNVISGALTIDTYSYAVNVSGGTLEATSLSGAVNVSGGTLEATSLSGAVTVTGGTLNVSGANAISGSSLSITNGTVNAYVNEDKTVINKATAVSIGAGGTLNLEGHDMLQYNGNALPSLTMKGVAGEGNLATLNIEDTGSLTLSTKLIMQGYSQVTGNKFNAFAYNNAIGVEASGVGNIISVSEMQLRNDWKVDVANSETQTGQLTISGKIVQYSGTSAKLIKTGAGTLTLSGTNTYTGGTDIQGGKVVASNGNALGTGLIKLDAGELEVANNMTLVNDIDMAGTTDATTGDTAKTGTLNVLNGAKLTLTGSTWVGNNASINISAGASLVKDKATITGTGKGAIIKRQDGITAQNANTYSLSSEYHTISNAAVSVSSESEVTLGNKLATVAVTNDNTGLLKITNEDNTLTAVDAAKGNITLQNTSKQELSTLAIAAGKTVAVYTGTDTANVGTLTVSGTATFGAGATLNSNLVLGTGAELTLSRALTMGGSLTLNTGLTLNYGDAVTAIATLADETSKVVLFTGVDKLYLGSNTEASGILTSADKVDISTYLTSDAFKSSETGDYYLGYDGSDVYVEFVAKADEPEEDPSTPEGGGNVPEPTTSALSLIGLAALAMRRRRK